jgi:NADPH:quinone reductase-like Zn-dependent oxidoreductase
MRGVGCGCRQEPQHCKGLKAVGSSGEKQVKSLASKPNQADLVTLKDLVETGKVTPFIDQTFSLNEVPAAIRYLEDRNVKGKGAISV